MNESPYWFADVVSEEGDGQQRPGWQPCLETRTGHIPCFDIWFETKEACEAWIQEFAVGAEFRR